MTDSSGIGVAMASCRDWLLVLAGMSRYSVTTILLSMPVASIADLENSTESIAAKCISFKSRSQNARIEEYVPRTGSVA